LATILLVDDDVDLVEMYQVVLAYRGHRVLCAYSAAEARETLKTEAPDVAVIDVMMESDTAGFDLARDLHQTFPAMPTLILSGVHSATGVPFRFEPHETWLPVLEFVDKPVQPAALADRIEAILRGK
jgi:two-component system, OmpR family, response regulator